jgi:hypothetical protein
MAILDPFGYGTHEVLNQAPAMADYDAYSHDPARDCHIAMGRARSVGGSGFFRRLRRRSAMCPSPQREARGAFGLK